MKYDEINGLGIFGIILWMIATDDITKLIGALFMLFFVIGFNLCLWFGDD